MEEARNVARRDDADKGSTVVDHRPAIRRGPDTLEQVGELLVLTGIGTRSTGMAMSMARRLPRCCGGTCLMPRMVTRPSIRPSMLWVGKDVN